MSDVCLIIVYTVDQVSLITNNIRLAATPLNIRPLEIFGKYAG